MSKKSMYILEFEREPDKEFLNLILLVVKRVSEDQGVAVAFGKVAGTGEDNR